jgi:hypothetical protein
MRPMTRRTLILPAFLLMFALLGLLGGCKFLPAKTIDGPTEGSPEWVVYKFIEGSQKADTMDAWTAVRPLLHSSVVELRTSEDNFLNMNFAAFRRKVRLFTPEDGKPTYKLDYTNEDVADKEHRLFIVNEASDQPSPFRLARDPNANNEWRVKTIP